jgi:hypothetical protein
MLLDQATRLDEPFTGHPIVNLLPGYDPYLLGYRRRDLVLAPEYASRIYPGGGLFHPALLVDGRAKGTWKIKRRRDHVEINVEPFEKLTVEIQRELELEVGDLAHFLGAEARLNVMVLP